MPKVNTVAEKPIFSDRPPIYTPSFVTKDWVTRDFRGLGITDFIRDVHDSLVVHLRRLENLIKDRFIDEGTVASERCQEKTLCRSERLQVGGKCFHNLFGAHQGGFV